MDTKEEKALKLLRGAINQPYCNDIVITKEDGEVDTSLLGAPCIASLEYPSVRANADALYSLLVHHTFPYSQRWYDYLLDKKRSPFKSILKDSEVFTREDGGYPYAVKIVHLDEAPLDLVCNFCIAIRYPKEYPDHVKSFEWLLDRGFSQASALFLSIVFVINPRTGAANYRNNQDGHKCFLPYSLSYRNLLEGAPTLISDEVFSNSEGSYSIGGLSPMWSRQQAEDRHDLLKGMVKNTPDDVPTKYNGSFSRAHNRMNNLVPREEIIHLDEDTIEYLKNSIHTWD